MNRTKLLTIAVVGLLVINLGTLFLVFFNKPQHPPHHGEGPPPPHGRGHGPRDYMIDVLQFDEAQQKQFDLLIKDHRSKSDELNEINRELHTELYGLLKSDTINQRTMDVLTQKIAENQVATDKLNFSHFQQVKALCTPEQLKNFEELAGELSRLFGGPKGGPPPPPPGM